MKIFIQQLEDGIHEFQENISPDNYDFLESEFFPGPIFLKAVVDKIEHLFRITLNIKTEAISVCDRCLDKFKNNINMTIEQLYQIGSSDFNQEDDIERLPENTKEIDLTKAIHDAFIMNRPIQLICDQHCKGLCPHCGTNLNKKKCNCTSTETDPRLEKLKFFIK